MNTIDAKWIRENAEFFGCDSYGFAVYKYHSLYITIDEDGDILAIEYEVK